MTHTPFLIILIQNIASRVGDYVAAYTLYSSVRPFGSSTIIAAMDSTGPKLYMVEPSGLYWVRLSTMTAYYLKRTLSISADHSPNAAITFDVYAD